MGVPVITADMVEDRLSWEAMARAIAEGHRRAPADLGDVFNRRGGDTLLTRSAWVDGLGMAVKSMSVFPQNVEHPTINGAMILFEDVTGQVLAVIDGVLLTKWKTAADSVLGARYLARKDARRVLIVGAGTVARSLIEAYGAIFPGIDISIWNRTRARAEALGVAVADDLQEAMATADIISSATMVSDPIIKGDWLRPGQHLDLIGAFRADMREADDRALKRGRIFVDSRATTLDHIGELKIPLAEGVIRRDDILGDLHDLEAGRAGRETDADITIFKNGGGAHLDLMVGRAIYDIWRAGA